MQTDDEYNAQFEWSPYNETVGVEYFAAGVPISVDWRSTAVTPAKDQKSTKSCTAHCAVDSVESFVSITNQITPVTLSPQHVIDCFETANLCVEGVDKKDVFNNVKSYGLASLEDYPWTGKKGMCRKDVKISARINNLQSVGKTEDDLKRHVARGPVAVSVRKTAKFSNYKYPRDKIYDEICPKNTNDKTTLHCVTVVGYIKKDSKPVWIIKNSWGKNWGDNGFMYMSRSSKNIG